MRKQMQSIREEDRHEVKAIQNTEDTIMTTRKLFTLSTTVLAIVLFAAGSANAGVILSTDFDNTGLGESANKMAGVTWTENGLTAPTTIAASASLLAGKGGDADVEGGYFGAAINVNGTTEGSPAWTTTFVITVGGNDITLSGIALSSVNSNANGFIGAGNGSSNIKLALVDNTSSSTIFNNTLARTADTQTLTYAATSTLTAGNTYNVTFTVWEDSSLGHFEAFDSLAFNGAVIPEPSSLLLFGLAGLALMGGGLRKRK